MTITGDLVPFHFGTLDDTARATVEEHLRACPACLSAYFDVKRAVERTKPPRPSPALRARLRESVSAEVRPRRFRAAPFAAAAACIALTVVALSMYHRAPAPIVEARDEVPAVPTLAPSQLPPRFGGAIDSARDPNQRLAFY